MAKSYDVIVLGSGPGGYVAAIRAAQLGLKTAIVERENLGGICLNWGCIPTKALLRTAEIFHQIQHADAYGLDPIKAGFDIAKVVKRSRNVAKQLNQGVTHLMKKNKIAVHMGEGKITAKGKLSVTGADGKTAELAAKHIIVATGARARDLPFAKADGKRIWTYRHAMIPTEMPTELLVIGSGAIGIEFASFYADLGAKVTVVEMLDRIVPVEDAEVSALLEKQLTKQGLKVLTSAGVESLKPDANGVAAVIKTKDGKSAEHRFSHAIVAVGHRSEHGEYRTRSTRREDDKGAHRHRPHVPHQCARHLGDRRRDRSAVACPQGEPRGRHGGRGHRQGARQQGRAPARDRSEEHPGLHLLPAAGRVGRPAPRPAAKENGYEVKVGKFPFIGNGKAIALGEVDGFVKTVFDAKTGELARRAHDRRRGDRADPGLHRRQDRRAGRDGLHPDRLPAPDAQRDDA